MILQDKAYIDLLFSKLGVKVGEWFRLVYANNGMLYDKRKFYVNVKGNLFDSDGFDRSHLLPPILLWQLIVVKLPFKPEYAEKYYFVNKYGNIGWKKWVDYEIDYYRFNAKNCFRTEEEITPKDIERILKEMKGGYHND